MPCLTDVLSNFAEREGREAKKTFTNDNDSLLFGESAVLLMHLEVNILESLRKCLFFTFLGDDR